MLKLPEILCSSRFPCLKSKGKVGAAGRPGFSRGKGLQCRDVERRESSRVGFGVGSFSAAPRTYPGKSETPGKVCIPGGAHFSQICWSRRDKVLYPCREGGGKATFILAGQRLLFPTCLSTGSSLFQPWPPAKFLSSFLPGEPGGRGLGFLQP